MKQGTPEHPKLGNLATRLGIRKWGAIGILESLWLFAQRFAERGDIGRFSDREIERAIGWIEQDGDLVPALIETGWLDLSEEHRLIIHDWHDHCGNWLRAKSRREGWYFVSEPRSSAPYSESNTESNSEIHSQMHSVRLGARLGSTTSGFYTEGGVQRGEGAVVVETPPDDPRKGGFLKVRASERYTANGWARQLWALLPPNAKRSKSKVDEAIAFVRREDGEMPTPERVAQVHAAYDASDEGQSRRRRGLARLILDRFWDEDPTAWSVPQDVKKPRVAAWAEKLT